jgi:hypothetical protein
LCAQKYGALPTDFVILMLTLPPDFHVYMVASWLIFEMFSGSYACISAMALEDMASSQSIFTHCLRPAAKSFMEEQSLFRKRRWLV